MFPSRWFIFFKIEDLPNGPRKMGSSNRANELWRLFFFLSAMTLLLVVLLNWLLAFSSKAYACGDCGFVIPNPTGAIAGSADASLSFQFNALKAMGDGRIRLTTATGFSSPTSANTQVDIDAQTGLLADVLDHCDNPQMGNMGTPGWVHTDASLGLATQLSLNTMGSIEGSGHLSLQFLADANLGAPTVHLNFSTPQDLSDKTTLSFWIRKSALVNLSIENIAVEISSQLDLASCHVIPLTSANVKVNLFGSNDWAQVVVDISAVPRTAVLSIGLQFSNLTVAIGSTIDLDYFLLGPGEVEVNGNTVTCNLIRLDANGSLTLHFNHMSVPNLLGPASFKVEASAHAGDSLNLVVNGSAMIQVVNPGDGTGGTQNSTSHDVDNDGKAEMAIDANSNATDGFEFYFDEDGSSRACASMDGDNDGKIDHFIATNGDCQGLPDIYWDPDEDRVSAINSTTLNGQTVGAFDSDGDGQADSFIGITSNNPSAGTPTLGGQAVGQANPFAVEGAGCQLVRDYKKGLNFGNGAFGLALMILCLLRRRHSEVLRK